MCWKLCYGRGIRYQSKGQKSKRERNFRTVEYLLAQGGPELLAENLLGLIDHARPVDFLSAKFSGGKTSLPWTIRIHDVGDFYSAEYVEAWRMVVQKRPECAFWFYTRSFSDFLVLQMLHKLVAAANCQGWISVDSENYREGLAVYSSSTNWKVAVLQQAAHEMPEEMMPAVIRTVAPSDLVVFPYPMAAGMFSHLLEDQVMQVSL